MRGHHLFAEHTAHSPFGSIACNDFTCRSGQGTRQHLNVRVFVLTDSIQMPSLLTGLNLYTSVRSPFASDRLDEYGRKNAFSRG